VGIAEAGGWGLAGGIAAGLVALSVSIVKERYKWPWKGNPDGIWPRVVVAAVGVVVGTLAAAAAHSQMTGAWPAFLMGVGAPSVIRGGISRIEVEEVEETKPEGTESEVTKTKAKNAPKAAPDPTPGTKRKKVSMGGGGP